MGTELILAALLALILGAGAGFFLRNSQANKELAVRQEKGDEIISKAKKDASDIKYKARKEAKDIIKEERQALDRELSDKTNNIKKQEKELDKKEIILGQKIEAKEKDVQRLKEKEKDLENLRNSATSELERYRKSQVEISEKLAVVASMTREEAKKELIDAMENEAKLDASKSIRKIEEEAKEEAEKKAKRVVGIAIQRFAGEYVAERTISSVQLPSDDVKGRLIGREGRNIRAFEQICGVDLIIDDTPEIVVISSFNVCLLYTSPSPRDQRGSRMPSSA